MAALGAPAARAGSNFKFEEIASGVFVHQGEHALVSPGNAGDIANASLVVGRDSVAVVDTGGSARVGAGLREAIRSVTKLPVRHVINTHMHPDHVFGNAAFESDGPGFIGHAKLARGLSTRAAHYLSTNRERIGEEAFSGTRVVLPTREIAERTEIDLGGRTLVLEPRKTAHTDNDMTVFDTATGTLFMGDLLFAGHVPTLDGSIRGWLALLDEIGTRPAKRVVPGHGPPSMTWPNALLSERRYLEAVAADVRQLIKKGRTLTDAVERAGRSEKDAWLLFEEYHARNVTAAFAELEWE